MSLTIEDLRSMEMKDIYNLNKRLKESKHGLKKHRSMMMDLSSAITYIESYNRYLREDKTFKNLGQFYITNFNLDNKSAIVYNKERLEEVKESITLSNKLIRENRDDRRLIKEYMKKIGAED